MKVINLTGSSYDVNIVVDNVAYIGKFTNGSTSYVLVATDGRSFPLSESQYNEVKTYFES